MASITIRNLDERTKARLRMQAARRGRSMEEEARHLLRDGLSRGALQEGNFADRVRARFQALGGLDLELPARAPMRKPPRLG